MLEIVTIDVDDECVPPPQKTKKLMLTTNFKKFGL
jgi:hypothetical protein